MDWLARLAFLSCLLSRWDSLDMATTMSHLSHLAINHVKLLIWFVHYAVCWATGTTGGPMMEFLDQVWLHLMDNIYWHLSNEPICSLLGFDQPCLDNVQQGSPPIPGQHRPCIAHFWPKSHTVTGELMFFKTRSCFVFLKVDKHMVSGKITNTGQSLVFRWIRGSSRCM